MASDYQSCIRKSSFLHVHSAPNPICQVRLSMPKHLSQYSVDDWLRLRPILHTLKSRRYERVNRRYIRQESPSPDVDRVRALIRNNRALVTVAFNDPALIERQVLAIREFIPGPLHVIADNSDDDAGAKKIEAVCTRLAVPYVRLPPSPWGPRSHGRSLGSAHNWIWHRLIRIGRPEAFGFVDHDLIPVASDDPFALLENGDLHGDKRWIDDRWFLWAGYCFFRTAFLEGKRVDFGQDWFLGLDTGGGNWSSIYMHLSPSMLPERPIERVAIVPGVSASDCYIERRGAWLHEVGSDNRPDLKTVKRERFFKLVDNALRSQTKEPAYSDGTN